MLQRGTGLSLAVLALMVRPVVPASMAFLRILLSLLKIVSGNHFDKAVMLALNETNSAVLLGADDPNDRLRGYEYCGNGRPCAHHRY